MALTVGHKVTLCGPGVQRADAWHPLITPVLSLPLLASLPQGHLRESMSRHWTLQSLRANELSDCVRTVTLVVACPGDGEARVDTGGIWAQLGGHSQG